MVSTRLKNISENANLLQVAVKIKDIWGHHLENNTGWLKFCHRSACDIHHHSPFRTFKLFKLYLVNTLSPNHLQPLVCHVVWKMAIIGFSWMLHHRPHASRGLYVLFFQSWLKQPVVLFEVKLTQGHSVFPLFSIFKRANLRFLCDIFGGKKGQVRRLVSELDLGVAKPSWESKVSPCRKYGLKGLSTTMIPCPLTSYPKK